MVSFDGLTSGFAKVIGDNEFSVDLPLHQYWRQNTSYVDVSIGISYNGQRFKFQNLQLFDSKCRYCDGSVSNEEIKVFV
jgi:hypothetical protein